MELPPEGEKRNMKKFLIEKFQELNYKTSVEELNKTLEFFSEKRKAMRTAIDKLSWSENEETQKLSIDILSNGLYPWEYIYLVMPGEYKKELNQGKEEYYFYTPYKDKWENAAKVILNIGWPKIKPILVPLFVWLLDSNWPGSEQIRQFILSLPKNEIDLAINTILDSPQSYKPYDYEDLKEIIEELKNQVPVLCLDPA